MPHFYSNWAVDDFRKFILNAVVWSAKLNVPAGGVKTTLPDLSPSSPPPLNPNPRSRASFVAITLRAMSPSGPNVRAAIRKMVFVTETLLQYRCLTSCGR